MKLTNKIKLNLSKTEFQILKEHSLESANCWNTIVSIAKNYYNENKKWLSKYEIQPLIKGKFKLFSTIPQGLTDKFDSNRKTISELRKSGDKKAKYPHREKTFFCIPLKTANFKKVENDKLKITLSKGNSIFVKFNLETPSYGEISFKDGSYFFFYSYSKQEMNSVNSDIKAGIDLGEVHSIAMTTSQGETLVLSNRLGRSIKRYRNKKLGQFSKLLSRCQKNSRRWKKLIKAKGVLKSRTKNQLRNFYHQTTAKAIKFAQANNVSEIICGDIKNVSKNTKKDKRVNKNIRQKLSQAEFGTLKTYLKYKAKLKGILFKLVNEAYSSQTCPVDNYRYKPSGRTYKCPSCGYTTHRDIVGAWNILNKKHKFPLVDFILHHEYPIKVSYQ